jgi:DNA-binding FrmR family transcriptional regulator
MEHPCHKQQIANIRRIEGQVRGVEKMITEGKYCIDILNQIKAIKNSLTTVEGRILKTHLEQCVKDSLDGSGDFNKKVEEIVKTLKR